MKAAKIAVVVVVISSLAVWCRSSFDFGHIARSLPFSGGHRPGIFDVGAVVMLLLGLWGLSRLRGGRERVDEASDIEDNEPAEDSYEGYETDDDDDE